MNPLYTELDNQDTLIQMLPTLVDLSLHPLSTVRCRASTPGVPHILIWAVFLLASGINHFPLQ